MNKRRLLLECVIGLLLALLIAYGIGISVDDLEFVYQNF